MSYSQIDPTIALQAGKNAQAPVNPLAVAGNYAQTANALNNLKLFPAQQQQLNLANQRSQIGVQSDQSSLINQQRQLAYAATVPLLAQKRLLTPTDLTDAWGAAEKGGVVTQPAIQEFSNVPMTGDPAKDDAAIRAHILANSQPPAAAAGAVTPGQTVIDAGPTIQPALRGAPGMPDQGAITPAGAPIQKGLTPSEATTPTPIGVTPTGAPVVGTRQQFIDKTGGAPSPLGTGRIPPALLNGTTPPGAAQPSAPGVVTGLGPAQVAAQSTAGAQSAHAFQDIADRGVQALGQNAILGTMLGDTSQFATGESGWNNFKTTLTRNAPAIAKSFNIAPDSIAANESFDKFANQIADAQGAGSDARLAVTQAANPSSHLSQAGADLIIRQLQGNADYIQARAKLAATYPDQTDRAGFEAKTGSQLDPRAFQFARMTPQQKVTFVSSIKSPQDKAKLQSSYNYAVGQGLIGGDNGGQ